VLEELPKRPVAELTDARRTAVGDVEDAGGAERAIGLANDAAADLELRAEADLRRDRRARKCVRNKAGEASGPICAKLSRMTYGASGFRCDSILAQDRQHFTLNR
jgi:hypothetical protein